MLKKVFIIININKGLFDYDILLDYLKKNSNVNSLYIISQGFFVEFVYATNAEYNNFIEYIKTLSVNDIKSHSVLYESSLSRYFNSKGRRS